MEFSEKEWIKNWAGNWSILSSTYLGEQYTQLLKETLGLSLELALFISKKGFTVCSFEKNDNYKFGNEMAQRLVKDPSKVEEWSLDLKSKTDKILNLIKELKSKKIEKEGYLKFIQAMWDYGSPHRAVKMAVDFLPADILKKYLPVLSKARVYAEPVYGETENFMNHYALQLSKETSYPSKLILAMTKKEINDFLDNGSLPKKSVLEQRFKSVGILFQSGKYKLLDSKDVTELEEEIENKLKEKKSIKGSVAFSGIVKGKVKLVFEPSKAEDFKDGEILVTAMTRPEYLPLIKKSAGFITDAGGMLSHAAITARELKKPCVIGTEIATKVLKDGDLVEIDANKGIVKILKK